MTDHQGGLRGSPWAMLILLTLINLLLTLDRTIPTMLVEPIKREFSLSDGQVGVLLGIAFGLPLGVVGLLMGPLIDRVNRTRYLQFLVAIWSVLTFMTGLAGSYLVLLLARAGLGAAEATGSPTAMSLVGDVFPPKRRSTAVGIFKVGVPLGIMLAGIIVGTFASTHGWRAAFYFAGIPGFITVFLMIWLMKEPKRGAMEVTAVEVSPVAYRVVLRFLFRNPVVSPFAAAMLLVVLSGAALQGFAASFLQRSHGFTLQDVSFYYTLGSALSIFSPILIGLVADRLTVGGPRRVTLFMVGYAAATAMAGLAMVLVPNSMIVAGGFLLWQFLALALTGPCYALLISLTPPGMRGTLLSLVSVANMSLGYGLGPILVGVTSDHIGGPESLKIALTLVFGIGSLLAVLLFWLSAHGMARVARSGGQAAA